MNEPLPDQTDVIAANERLTAERDAALAERDQARDQVTALTSERDSALRERDEARDQAIALTAERDRLAAIDRDFNRRLAAELARHGIRPEAVAPAATKPTDADVITRYLAITDPVEKGRFLAEHDKAIRRLLISTDR